MTANDIVNVFKTFNCLETPNVYFNSQGSLQFYYPFFSLNSSHFEQRYAVLSSIWAILIKETVCRIVIIQNQVCLSITLPKSEIPINQIVERIRKVEAVIHE